MRAVVTGGCGFIGSNLVDKLISLGHEVVVIDSLSIGSIRNANPKAQMHYVDIRQDLADFWQFNCDVIFHLAAISRIQPSFSFTHDTISVNSTGTVRVLDVARKYGAKLVYAGSSSYYDGTHLNPYAHSKWIGEEHCRFYNKCYGVSVVIPRFFNVYGPKHVQKGEFSTVVGIFENLRSQNKPLTITGSGEQRRDFTHVDDVVNALIAMSKDKWNGEVLDLGSGENFSIREVAEMFKPVAVEYLPARRGEAKDTLADIRPAKEKLGWEPRRRLPDYVAEFLRTLG